MPMQIRRTLTANLPPPTLAEGQLAVEMASSPVKLWVGVPTSIDASGRRLVNAGGITVAATAPLSPNDGDLWWDSVGGALYLYYDDGTTAQWVGMPLGQAGVQGPQGIPGTPGGTFPDVVAAGAYLRQAGNWVPMTAMSAGLAADQAFSTPAFTDGPTLNVGNAGTWLVIGTASMYSPSGAFYCIARIWDGVTIMADAIAYATDYNSPLVLSLSGIISNPAGPLRLSGSSPDSAAGMMAGNFYNANVPSTTRQTHITAVRVG